jgi:hypothetical protein
MATTRLGMTYLAEGQNSAELLVNSITDHLEAFGFFDIEDRNAVTPPGSPATGALYHLGASPTGVWAGQAGKIAGFFDGAWTFYTSQEGWRMWVKNENLYFIYDGSSWLAQDWRATNVKREILTIIAPGAAEDKTFFFTHDAITVKRLAAVLVTAVGSPSVSWTVKFATDRSAAGTAVVTAGTTTTSITTGTNTTTFNAASIPADAWVWVETTASNLVAGDQITIALEFVTTEPA